jgi:hypothetical protein
MAIVITLKDAAALAGEKIELSATGFNGGETVSVYLAGDAVDTLSTNILGELEAQVKIPADAASGATKLSMEGSTSREQGDITFTVS